MGITQIAVFQIAPNVAAKGIDRLAITLGQGEFLWAREVADASLNRLAFVGQGEMLLPNQPNRAPMKGKGSAVQAAAVGIQSSLQVVRQPGENALVTAFKHIGENTSGAFGSFATPWYV